MIMKRLIFLKVLTIFFSSSLFSASYSQIEGKIVSIQDSTRAIEASLVKASSQLHVSIPKKDVLLKSLSKWKRHYDDDHCSHPYACECEEKEEVIEALESKVKRTEESDFYKYFIIILNQYEEIITIAWVEENSNCPDTLYISWIASNPKYMRSGGGRAAIAEATKRSFTLGHQGKLSWLVYTKESYNFYKKLIRILTKDLVEDVKANIIKRKNRNKSCAIL